MTLPLRWCLLLSACLAGALALWPSHANPLTQATLQPLVRPGRMLQFRGRSSLQVSQADLPPAPQVGFVLSRLRVTEQQDDGWLLLDEETFLYAADGESMDRMDSPRDRRTREIRVQPGTGRLAGGTLRSHPPQEGSRLSRTVEITRSDDGFGLNAQARTAAGVPSLVLPADLYAALARQETLTREFDFWLVRGDPRADRDVVPVGDDPRKIPAGAEGRVRGSTRFRPRGRESFPFTFRSPAPAAAPDRAPDPVPDERVKLTVLAVSVHLDLAMEWLPTPEGSVPPTVRRQDRMHWIVLDDPAEPWILEREGNVTFAVGAPPGTTRREAYLVRRLDLVVDDPS